MTRLSTTRFFERAERPRVLRELRRRGGRVRIERNRPFSVDQNWCRIPKAMPQPRSGAAPNHCKVSRRSAEPTLGFADASAVSPLEVRQKLERLEHLP